MLKGFPDGSVGDLFRRLRDDLVELLSRQTGRYLHDSVDGVSGGAGRAAITHENTADRAQRLISTDSRDARTSPGHPDLSPTSRPVDESMPPETELRSPGAVSHSDKSGSGPTEHFVVSLTRADRDTFASLVDKLGLMHLVGNPGLMKTFAEIQGKTFTASESRLVGLFENMHAGQGGKLDDLNLEFRWVSADRGLRVPQLVQDARVHGGAEPDAPWTHIGDSVVEDFMEQHRGPGVLFVYDGDKLRSPTKEEKDADWADPNGKHAYMYAKKPVDGLELKDALVGMVRFDASGAE